MIKEPNMSVEQPHSLGAVLKGAILLIFFVFGVTTYAQSYNAPISYRISGTTQSTVRTQPLRALLLFTQATIIFAQHLQPMLGNTSVQAAIA